MIQPSRQVRGLLLVLLLVATVVACASPAAPPTSVATQVVAPAATATRPVPPVATALAAATPTTVTGAVVPSGPPAQVKIGYVPILNFAAAYVAADKGYFKEQNIEVSFERTNAGADIMAFLAQGQIDVGAVGLSAAAFNAANRGFDFKVIATASSSAQKDDPLMLAVSKTQFDAGTIKQVSDLKGKKVAVSGGKGTAGAYLLSRALATGGLTINDVEVVNLGNPDMEQALKNGAVDAMLVGSPFSVNAVRNGVAQPLYNSWAGIASTVYLYSGKFIKERPDVARRFAVALMKGSRDLQGDKYLSADNIKAFEKYTGTKEDVLRSVPSLTYDPNLAILRESISDQEKVHRESGTTEYKTAFDVTKLFDTSFIEYAIQQLGRAQ